MKIFRFYTYTLEKGNKPYQVIEMITKYLNDNNLRYKNLCFHFDNFIHEANQDGEYHTNKQTESIAKLCDEKPELKPFHRIKKGVGHTNDISILSNYSEDWKMSSASVSDLNCTLGVGLAFLQSASLERTFSAEILHVNRS